MGHEDQISDCSKNDYFSVSCSRNDIVGITCWDGKELYKLF